MQWQTSVLIVCNYAILPSLSYCLLSLSLSPHTHTPRSNIGAIRNQVDDVKEATRQNIGKVVARGEKLDDLQAKAQGLEYEANGFRKGARAVHRKEGCNYCKVLVLSIAWRTTHLLVFHILTVFSPLFVCRCKLYQALSYSVPTSFLNQYLRSYSYF